MSYGLAEYVPFDPCPCPAVAIDWEWIPSDQLPAGNPGWTSNQPLCAGLGDILSGWRFPVPQSLNGQGTGLGDFLANFSFPVPQSLNGQGTGLGDFTLTAPGGYFATSPAQWGVAEWVTVAAGVYLGASAFGDAKRAAPHLRKASKRARSAATSAAGGLGTAVLVGAGAIGLYMFWQSTQGAAQ